MLAYRFNIILPRTMNLVLYPMLLDATHL